MKTQHDGDCTIDFSLVSGKPENGICTCGYGLQLMRQGDYSQMYSEDFSKRLESSNLVRRMEEDIE